MFDVAPRQRRLRGDDAGIDGERCARQVRWHRVCPGRRNAPRGGNIVFEEQRLCLEDLGDGRIGGVFAEPRRQARVLEMHGGANRVARLEHEQDPGELERPPELRGADLRQARFGFLTLPGQRGQDGVRHVCRQVFSPVALLEQGAGLQQPRRDRLVAGHHGQHDVSRVVAADQ